MKNQLLWNNGAKRFDDVSPMGGPALARAEVGRGAAFGDLDNDGDVDVVVTNNGGPTRLLVNQTGSREHWVQIRLEQPGANRSAVGAWIGLERAGRPTLFRRVRSDGSYLSASDLRAHFGLGATPPLLAVTVQWPDGERERWAEVTPDRVVTLRRSSKR